MKSLNWSLVFVGIVMGALCLIITAVAPDGWNHRNESPTFINPITLAEKIKNKEEILVIDLRPQEEYKEFHLPTSRNIPLNEIKFDSLDSEFIVFYSGDDWIARQLWNSLSNEQREKSQILYGGIHDWYDHVLYPKLPVKPLPEDSILVERLWNLSNFYGGQADFINNNDELDYYKLEMSSASWPKPKARQGLVRKGC